MTIHPLLKGGGFAKVLCEEIREGWVIDAS